MRWNLDSDAAHFCRLVYTDPDKLLEFSVGEVVHCEGPEFGADAYVFEGLTHNWVVFRGLDIGTVEYLGDLRNALRAYRDRVSKQYRIHRGFFEAWQEISSEVFEEVFTRTHEQQYEDGETKPVVYCGHSAGGALATIAAATHVPQALITFGAPRTANKALAEPLSGIPMHHRWTNGSDLVPTVPFGMGYRHHGHHVLIKADGEVVEKPTWFRRVWEVLRDLGGSGDNHNMLAYRYGVLAQQYLEAP